MASLVQQRVAIERIRMSAFIWLSFGGIWLIIALIQVALSDAFLNLVLGAGWIVIGAFCLRRYRREIKAFAVESGVDVGRRPGS